MRMGYIACYSGIQLFVIKMNDFFELDKYDDNTMYIIKETGEIIHKGYYVGDWNFENNEMEKFDEPVKVSIQKVGKKEYYGGRKIVGEFEGLSEVEIKNIELKSKEG